MTDHRQKKQRKTSHKTTEKTEEYPGVAQG